MQQRGRSFSPVVVWFWCRYDMKIKFKKSLFRTFYSITLVIQYYNFSKWFWINLFSFVKVILFSSVKFNLFGSKNREYLGSVTSFRFNLLFCQVVETSFRGFLDALSNRASCFVVQSFEFSWRRFWKEMIHALLLEIWPVWHMAVLILNLNCSNH